MFHADNSLSVKKATTIFAINDEDGDAQNDVSVVSDVSVDNAVGVNNVSIDK